MKKFKKILLFVVCFLFIILASGCSSKEAIEAEDFKVIMSGLEFTISDATDEYVQNEYVTKVYVAVSSNEEYKIEFYEFSDGSSGLDFYNSIQTKFENSKTGSSVYSSVNLGNYSKYTLSTDGKYKVVSRIDNTAVYLDVDDVYKDEVKGILDNLGY